jgi:hypothetical protein
MWIIDFLSGTLATDFWSQEQVKKVFCATVLEPAIAKMDRGRLPVPSKGTYASYQDHLSEDQEYLADYELQHLLYSLSRLEWVEQIDLVVARMADHPFLDQSCFAQVLSAQQLEMWQSLVAKKAAQVAAERELTA